jgi:hypothetical protein
MVRYWAGRLLEFVLVAVLLGLLLWAVFYPGEGPTAGEDPCVYHQSGVHLRNC